VKLPVAGQTDLLQPPGQAASLQQGKSWPETRLLARRQEIEKEREMVCDCAGINVIFKTGNPYEKIPYLALPCFHDQ
jgi:hypothetical protein